MKKITILLAFLAAFSWQGMAQTTLYLTTYGGSFTSEKWVEITDGPNGTGTVLWAQGNGTYGDGQGLVTDSSFTIVDGTTYYISCYDRYADGWDGTKYDINTAPGRAGTVVASNGGVSPDDGTDTDVAAGSWETRALERESEESFSYTPPACPLPTVLTATSITTSAVDLGWTENGPASIWDVEWDTAGFTQGAGTMVTGTTTNPYYLTGLTANTSYEFYVRADCAGSGTSTWVGPFSFSTLCNTFTVPFNEGFNSSSTSIGCWSVVDNNADGDTWSVNTSSSFTQEGDQSMDAYTDYNGGANDDYLISPQITLTANNRLKFWYRARSTSEPNDYKVLVSTTTNALASFTDTILVDTATSTTYAEHVIDLSAYTGNVFIAFYIPTGGLDGYHLYIDNFTVEVIPSCLAPSALTAANITTTSADLGWTIGGSETIWDIEWDTTGFTQGTGSMVTGTTTNPHSISGLSSNTAYEFYVRADCGGTTSTWAGPFSFTTTCSIMSSYSEDFEGIGVNCWSTYVNAANIYASVTLNTSGANSGSRHIRFYNSSDLNPWLLLISPQLSNLGAGTYQTSFYAKDADANDIIIGTMSDPSDTLTFTPFDTITTTSTYSEYIVSFASYAGTDTYIAYRSMPGGTYDYTYMDDAKWEAIPTCPKPSMLTVANMTNNAVDLGWTENGAATAWQVNWDTAGFTQGNGTLSSASSNPFSLTGLTANTNYEYYVRSVCGAGDTSVWVGSLAFATKPDTINTFPYTNGFESGLGLYAGLSNNANSNAELNTIAANAGTYGVLLTGKTSTGWSGNSTSGTETEAFVNSASHISAVNMIVDATALTAVKLKFDMKQTYSYGPKYSWGRVLVNGVQIGASVNPTGNNTDPFTTAVVDLSAYAGTSFTLSIEHSGKYSIANGTGGRGDDAFIDNVELYVPVSGSATVDSNVTCNGYSNGGATAVGTGGTTPYTYLWSNSATTASITGVMAGTYLVSVIDAVNDTATSTVTITEPASLALDLGNDTALCMGVTMTLDAGTFTSHLWDDATTMQTRSVATTTVGATTYWVEVSDGTCMASDTIVVTVAAPVVPNLGNDTTVCMNASLTLDAGTGFTSHLWDDATTMQTRVLANTTVGMTNYFVTTDDANGCTASDSIHVTVVTPMVPALGNDTTICMGASLTLDAGTFTTYMWDDATTMQTRMVSGTTAGMVNYYVTTADANGCAGSDSIMVTTDAAVMVNLGNDTTVCMNATMTLDAGTFTSYMWDDASTMQTRAVMTTAAGATDYSVVVTNMNGCTGNDTINVTVDAMVVVDLGNDTLLCNGESYMIDAGSGFSTYVWNNGTNMQTLTVTSVSDAATTYSVVVENSNGCTGTDMVIITTKDPIVVDLGADTNIWDPSVTSYTLDAGAGFSAYAWSDNVTTTQTYDVTPSADSNVSVVVTDADGCTGSDTVVVDFVLSVNSFEASTLRMYPNPAVDQVTIELSNFKNVSEVNVTFVSITGQTVLTQKVNVNGNSYVGTFDVSKLATGTYFVQFEANGEVVTRQFVIK